jgi:hypothetical protein
LAAVVAGEVVGAELGVDAGGGEGSDGAAEEFCDFGRRLAGGKDVDGLVEGDEEFGGDFYAVDFVVEDGDLGDIREIDVEAVEGLSWDAGVGGAEGEAPWARGAGDGGFGALDALAHVVGVFEESGEENRPGFLEMGAKIGHAGQLYGIC